METVTLARGAKENGLCVMLEGILTECARRHGGRLYGLGSRLGVEAVDGGDSAKATLIFGGGRCTIEDGLSFPDLVLRGGSELFPRVSELPVRYGVPWIFSEQGRQLLVMALTGQVQVRGLIAGSLSPMRTMRAALDLLLLVRLLAGGEG